MSLEFFWFVGFQMPPGFCVPQSTLWESCNLLNQAPVVSLCWRVGVASSSSACLALLSSGPVLLMTLHPFSLVG